MQPFKLVREGTEKAIAQACGECGRVYPLDDTYAIRCCDPRCADCKAALPPKWTWTVCDPCLAASRTARKQERVGKAKRVAEADYTGPLYVEDSSLGNDGFFSDIDALREECEDMELPLPDVVWACTRKRFTLPSADEMVDRECESGEHYDDIADSLTDTADLQRAIDLWNARQTAESWDADFGTLVVLGATTHPERAPVPAVDPSFSVYPQYGPMTSPDATPGAPSEP